MYRLYISSTVQVHVRDVVYELLGEISSDESDTELEHYLIKTNNECSDLQGMAKNKTNCQKARTGSRDFGRGASSCYTIEARNHVRFRFFNRASG